MAAFMIAGGVLCIKQYIHSITPLPKAALVLIEPGSGIIEISESLANNGVITKPYLFAASAALLKKNRLFKAGEYEFKPDTSIEAIMDILASGKVFIRKLTIPEGITVHDAVEIINSADAMTGEIVALPPEGSIMPETYIYTRNHNRQDLLNKMLKDMNDFATKAWNARTTPIPINDVNQLLTLASIVEKETSIESERRTVAAVYVNRLKRGMKLEADPTVIYGITSGRGKLGRSLTFADLKAPTEYNTYTIAALPPTPIAIPGKASIMAVLNPEDVDYVFFVANGDGGHNFATNYDEHKKNVMIWRAFSK